MNTFESAEPRFFAHWRAANRDDDPQLARWIEYEGRQIKHGHARLQEVAEHIDLSGKALLDVGCQWGAMTIAAAHLGAIPTGMDVEENLMVGARIRAEERGVNASFQQGYAEAMPFPDDSFDVAVCVNVLEHVRNHRATVRELVRVVKPGGHIYVDGPNRWSPGWMKCDPHFELPGISFLPPRIGAFYITRVREHPSYDVGTFPTGPKIRRMLTAAGCAIAWTNEGQSRDSLLLRGRTQSDGLRSAADFALRKMFVIVARPE